MIIERHIKDLMAKNFKIHMLKEAQLSSPSFSSYFLVSKAPNLLLLAFLCETGEGARRERMLAL